MSERIQNPPQNLIILFGTGISIMVIAVGLGNRIIIDSIAV